MKLKLGVLLLGIGFIIGCGSNDISMQGEKSSPLVMASASPTDLPPSSSAEGLNRINELILAQWDSLKDEFAIAFQYMGVGKEELFVSIRSFGEVERVLTEADLEAIKARLFDIAGEEFPLDLSVWECCTGEPQVTGVITDIDQEANRILIVNELEKNGNTENPVAHWAELTEDGLFLLKGAEASTFDESLIGLEAKAWTTGLVLQSYPGQVSALKVLVE